MMNDARHLLSCFIDSGVDVILSEEPVNHLQAITSNEATPPPTLHEATSHPPKPEKTIAPVIAPDHAYQEAVKLAGNAPTIDALYQALLSFDGCSLKRTAINTVMYQGVEKASIMVIGEAPGADEDRQGIPFCGMSGQLLDQMLASIGLSREKNIYITNSIFWRPPGNRRPTSEEIHICRPFLERQITLVQPKILLLFGAIALESVLGIKKTMSSIRGKMFDYQPKESDSPIKASAIFHPSYLLRSPIQKKKVWFDLLKLQEYIQQQQILDD